jgi:hypothetical protein
MTLFDEISTLKRIRAAVNSCLRSLASEPVITKAMVVDRVAASFPDHLAAAQGIVASVFRKRFER